MEQDLDSIALLFPEISVSKPLLKPLALTTTVQKKSFVEALQESSTISLSQLPLPCEKGGYVSIKISEDEYQIGVEECKKNLIGRLVLSKGETPWLNAPLKSKLSALWAVKEAWILSPIGRGYYNIQFNSVEDKRRVRAIGSSILNPGIFRISDWSKDFTPSAQKQTHSQCWIRLTDLPVEYWRLKTLFEIARGVGCPLQVDPNTLRKVYGHYARILVDVDCAHELPDELLVERECFAFLVGVTYERLPNFCSHCRTIGHHNGKCKHLHKGVSQGKTVEKGTIPQNRSLVRRTVRQEYVQKENTLNVTTVVDRTEGATGHINGNATEGVQVTKGVNGLATDGVYGVNGSPGVDMNENLCNLSEFGNPDHTDSNINAAAEDSGINRVGNISSSNHRLEFHAESSILDILIDNAITSAANVLIEEIAEKVLEESSDTIAESSQYITVVLTPESSKVSDSQFSTSSDKQPSHSTRWCDMVETEEFTTSLSKSAKKKLKKQEKNWRFFQIITLLVLGAQLCLINESSLNGAS